MKVERDFAFDDVRHDRPQLPQGNGDVPISERPSLQGVLDDRQDRFVLEPMDLRELLARDFPAIEFLVEPHIPRGRRIWGFGAAESAKSMWAMQRASEVSRRGRDVVFVSQENPLDEDVRRLKRLGPDPDHFRFFHGAGLDLTKPDHIAAFFDACGGTELVVLDTFTACWSGKEDDNAAVATFDRNVLMPVLGRIGASIVVLDHTGHPQPFVRRQGVNAGRGASAKGQKADVVLEFISKGEREFMIRAPKMRAGDGRKPPELLYRVVDTDDGGLDVELVGENSDVKVAALADAMVDAITTAGTLTTKALREAMKSTAGVELQSAAMKLLEAEDPPRVRVAFEHIDTGKGRQRAKVWRVSDGEETLDV